MTLAERMADAVLVVHAAFVLFVVLGGLLALRWPRVAWLHVPAAVWGAIVEVAGLTCPLTPLEDRLRGAGESAGGGGDFIERLLLPVLYPDWLTRETQLALGAGVVLLNVVVYAWVLRRRSLDSPAAASSPRGPVHRRSPRGGYS